MLARGGQSPDPLEGPGGRWQPVWEAVLSPQPRLLVLSCLSLRLGIALTTLSLHDDVHPHLSPYLQSIFTALLWDPKQGCEAGRVGIIMAV